MAGRSQTDHSVKSKQQYQVKYGLLNFWSYALTTANSLKDAKLFRFSKFLINDTINYVALGSKQL
jgi:hypothetical protein